VKRERKEAKVAPLITEQCRKEVKDTLLRVEQWKALRRDSV
jgi:hypothetical protein